MDREDEQDLHLTKNQHQHFEKIYELEYQDQIFHHDDRDPREKEDFLLLKKQNNCILL